MSCITPRFVLALGVSEDLPSMQRAWPFLLFCHVLYHAAGAWVYTEGHHNLVKPAGTSTWQASRSIVRHPIPARCHLDTPRIDQQELGLYQPCLRNPQLSLMVSGQLETSWVLPLSSPTRWQTYVSTSIRLHTTTSR